MKTIPLKLAALAISIAFLTAHVIADDDDMDQDIPNDDDAMVEAAIARLNELQATTQPTTGLTTQPTTRSTGK